MVSIFQIDDIEFTLKRLPLEDACKGLELVGGIAGPAMATNDFVSAITAAVGKLPQLIALFAPHCKVQGEGIGMGGKLPLAKFVNETFNGHLDRAILFAANAAAEEYGDFLGAGIERLSAGLQEMGQRFPSLMARIPSSGDSSSAPM
jgi:hypothetical protein